MGVGKWSLPFLEEQHPWLELRCRFGWHWPTWRRDHKWPIQCWACSSVRQAWPSIELPNRRSKFCQHQLDGHTEVRWHQLCLKSMKISYFFTSKSHPSFFFLPFPGSVQIVGHQIDHVQVPGFERERQFNSNFQRLSPKSTKPRNLLRDLGNLICAINRSLSGSNGSCDQKILWRENCTQFLKDI